MSCAELLAFTAWHQNKPIYLVQKKDKSGNQMKKKRLQDEGNVGFHDVGGGGALMPNL